MRERRRERVSFVNIWCCCCFGPERERGGRATESPVISVGNPDLAFPPKLQVCALTSYLLASDVRRQAPVVCMARHEQPVRGREARSVPEKLGCVVSLTTSDARLVASRTWRLVAPANTPCKRARCGRSRSGLLVGNEAPTLPSYPVGEAIDASHEGTARVMDDVCRVFGIELLSTAIILGLSRCQDKTLSEAVSPLIARSSCL